MEQKREDYNDMLRPDPTESLEERAKVSCLAYQEDRVYGNWSPGACDSASLRCGLGPRSGNQRILEQVTSK